MELDGSDLPQPEKISHAEMALNKETFEEWMGLNPGESIVLRGNVVLSDFGPASASLLYNAPSFGRGGVTIDFSLYAGTKITFIQEGKFVNNTPWTEVAFDGRRPIRFRAARGELFSNLFGKAEVNWKEEKRSSLPSDWVLKRVATILHQVEG